MPHRKMLAVVLVVLAGGSVAAVAWSRLAAGPAPVGGQPSCDVLGHWTATITFGRISKIDGVTWSFCVASGPAVDPWNYSMNFGIGVNTGSAVTMGGSNVNTTVQVPGATPSSVGIKWTDVNGNGKVDTGDRFTVSFPSVPVGGTSLTFYVLSGGAQVQSLQWTA